MRDEIDNYINSKYKIVSHIFSDAKKTFMLSEWMISQVLFDKNTHELLGAHMIGANMTELIHAIAVAKSAELLPEDIDLTIFAHPTVSEMIPEAILDAFGKAIHK